MNESRTIPRWIIFYGYFQALLVIGFGAMFFINSNPTVVSDPSWFVGGRNVAILAILLLALIRKDAKFLFAAYLLRLIVDLGDMVNTLLAGEFVTALSFIPLVIIPLAYGAWTLWNITKEEEAALS